MWIFALPLSFESHFKYFIYYLKANIKKCVICGLHFHNPLLTPLRLCDIIRYHIAKHNQFTSICDGSGSKSFFLMSRSQWFLYSYSGWALDYSVPKAQLGFIHFFSPTYPIQGRRGVEACLSCHRVRAEYTLDMLPANRSTTLGFNMS